MGTVLVDRYRVECVVCGLDEPFMVGAGTDWQLAVLEGVAIHASEAARRNCDPDEFVRITLEEKDDEVRANRLREACDL